MSTSGSGFTALVTGASAGLGVEYARLFAADKHDLVLVARRKDRLEQLAEELRKAHGVTVHVVAADLGAADGAAQVVGGVEKLGVTVEFLVNNAGFGTSGVFTELDEARELEMIAVNITTLTALTRAFLPGMVKRGRGRVLNIGSTAGFQPGPYMAVYYASKAYVNSFTEALAHELRGTGVTATVSCPGATVTEFGAVSGVDRSRLFRSASMPAADVAREGYRAMLAGKALAVHGFKNAVFAFSVRLSPRWAVRAIAGALNRQPPTAQLKS